MERNRLYPTCSAEMSLGTCGITAAFDFEPVLGSDDVSLAHTACMQLATAAVNPALPDPQQFKLDAETSLDAHLRAWLVIYAATSSGATTRAE